MAESHSEYHPGQMDIHAQEQTFKGFINGSKWGSLAVAVGVLLLTLWFCTPVGFLGAVISSAVLLVIGIAALKEKRGSAAH